MKNLCLHLFLILMSIGCVAQLAPQEVNPLEFSGDGIAIGTDQVGIDTGNEEVGIPSSMSVQNFQNTLYPITSLRCNECHQSSHGAINVNVAYNAIILGSKVSLASPSQSLIYNRVKSGHGCWPNSNSCEQNAADILAEIEQWAALDGFASGNNNNSQPATNVSLQSFQTTLFPLMSSCSGCHSNFAYNTSAHGSSDPATAHDAMFYVDSQGRTKVNFVTPNQSRLYTKVNGGHQGFGAALASQILAAINAWKAAGGGSSGTGSGNSVVSQGRVIMPPIGTSLQAGDVAISADQMTVSSPAATFDKVYDEVTATGAPFYYVFRTGGNNTSPQMLVNMSFNIPSAGSYSIYVLHRVAAANRTYQYQIDSNAFVDFTMTRNTESYNPNNVGNRIYYEWSKMNANPVSMTAGAHTMNINMGRLGDARVARVVFVREEPGRVEFIARRPGRVGVIPMRQLVKNGSEIVFDITPVAQNYVIVDYIRFNFSVINQPFEIGGLKPLINGHYNVADGYWAMLSGTFTQTAVVGNGNFNNQPVFSVGGPVILLESDFNTDQISMSIDNFTP